MKLGLSLKLPAVTGRGGSGLPPISRVLAFGDSNVALGASSLYQTGAFWGWTRLASGSGFDMVPNLAASRPYFGAGGLTTSELVAYVDEAVAAEGDICLIMLATNDAQALGNMTTAAGILRDDICAPILASGKMPVVIATPPIPQGTTSGANNNTTWQMSDKVVEFRDLAEAHAAAGGWLYINPMAVVENGTPGRADPAKMASDTDPHFSPYGAQLVGAEVWSLLSATYRATVNPLAVTTFTTPNAEFSGTLGSNPPGWFYFPGDGSITGALVGSGADRRWRLTIAANKTCNVWHPGAATGFEDGQELDVLLRLEVQSGEILFGGVSMCSSFNNRLAHDLYSAAARPARLTNADGLKIFRTIPYVIDGESNAIPQLDFTSGASGAVIDILASCGVRMVADAP